MKLHLQNIDFPDPDKQYQPEFSTVENETFDTRRIHVDNHQFGSCRFVNCTFVYSGGPFGFHECEVEGDFLFSATGSARRAVELFQFFVNYDKSRPRPL
jgi:hypothetical protein